MLQRPMEEGAPCFKGPWKGVGLAAKANGRGWTLLQRPMEWAGLAPKANGRGWVLLQWPMEGGGPCSKGQWEGVGLAPKAN